jgi:transcription antitermination factor NusG
VLNSDYVGLEGTILAGPLAGIHGKIIEVKNRKCFTMRIDGIERVLSVTIPASLFKPLSEANPRDSYRWSDPSEKI